MTSEAASSTGLGLRPRRRSAGSLIVKTLPSPGTLWTVTSPPIIWQKRRVRARPRPVPPNLRVVEASAWVKSWKSLTILSGLRPMPVSVTRNTIHSLPSMRCASGVQRDVAFVRELGGVRQEIEQPLAHLDLVGAHGAEVRRRARCAACCAFFSTIGWMVEATSVDQRVRDRSSRGTAPSCRLRSSTRSRMSLISASRCLPAPLIFSRSAPNESSSCSAASSCSISE